MLSESLTVTKVTSKAKVRLTRKDVSRFAVIHSGNSTTVANHPKFISFIY